MANQLKMAEIHAILTLCVRGWSFRRIARELGIHRETVARYVRRARPASKPSNAPIGPAPPKPARLLTTYGGWFHGGYSSTIDKQHASRFQRIHRSFLLNINHVREIRLAGSSTDYEVALRTGRTPSAGHAPRDPVVARLEGQAWLAKRMLSAGGLLCGGGLMWRFPPSTAGTGTGTNMLSRKSLRRKFRTGCRTGFGLFPAWFPRKLGVLQGPIFDQHVRAN